MPGDENPPSQEVLAGLVENLVLQCEGRTGALPLLQYALQQLWSEHATGRLPDSRWSSRLLEDLVVQVAGRKPAGIGRRRRRGREGGRRADRRPLADAARAANRPEGKGWTCGTAY